MAIMARTVASSLISTTTWSMPAGIGSTPISTASINLAQNLRAGKLFAQNAFTTADPELLALAGNALAIQDQLRSSAPPYGEARLLLHADGTSSRLPDPKGQKPSMLASGRHLTPERYGVGYDSKTPEENMQRLGSSDPKIKRRALHYLRRVILRPDQLPEAISSTLPLLKDRFPDIQLLAAKTLCTYLQDVERARTTPHASPRHLPDVSVRQVMRHLDELNHHESLEMRIQGLIAGSLHPDLSQRASSLAKLETLFADSSIPYEVHTEIAGALGTHRHTAAIDFLIAHLAQGNRTSRARAAEALEHISTSTMLESASTEALTDLATIPTDDRLLASWQQYAAYRILKNGTPDQLTTFIEQLLRRDDAAAAEYRHIIFQTARSMQRDLTPALLDTMDRGKPALRRRAAHILSQNKEMPQRLQNMTPEKRAKMVRALLEGPLDISALFQIFREVTASTLPALEAAGDHEDAEVRRKALKLLGKLNALPKLLGQSNREKSQRIVHELLKGSQVAWEHSALFRASGPAIIPLLIDALESPDLRIAKHAAYNLGVIKDQAARDALFAKIDHPEEEARASILQAMAKQQDARALKQIIEWVASQTPLASQRYQQPLLLYAWDATIDPLLALLDDPREDARYQAIMELGRFGQDEHIRDALYAHRDDPHPLIRQEIVYLLGRNHHDVRILPDYIELLGIRELETEIMGELDAWQEAEIALPQALQHAEQTVYLKAATLLAKRLDRAEPDQQNSLMRAIQSELRTMPTDKRSHMLSHFSWKGHDLTFLPEPEWQERLDEIVEEMAHELGQKLGLDETQGGANTSIASFGSVSQGLSISLRQELSMQQLLRTTTSIEIESFMEQEHYEMMLRSLHFLVGHEFGHLLADRKKADATATVDTAAFSAFEEDQVTSQASETAIDALSLAIGRDVYIYGAGDVLLDAITREAIVISSALSLYQLMLTLHESGERPIAPALAARSVAVMQEMLQSDAISARTARTLQEMEGAYRQAMIYDDEGIPIPEDQFTTLVGAYRSIFQVTAAEKLLPTSGNA